MRPAEDTQRNTTALVRTSAAFLSRSPETATLNTPAISESIESTMGVRSPTNKGSVSALRLLFTVTLDGSDPSRRPVLVRHAEKPRPR